MTTNPMHHPLDTVTGHNDPPARHFWETAARLAMQMRNRGQLLGMRRSGIYATTIDELHGEALRDNQRLERAQTWTDAEAAAQILYGGIEREHVLAVLRDWALNEEHDRS